MKLSKGFENPECWFKFNRIVLNPKKSEYMKQTSDDIFEYNGIILKNTNLKKKKELLGVITIIKDESQNFQFQLF